MKFIGLTFINSLCIVLGQVFFKRFVGANEVFEKSASIPEKLIGLINVNLILGLIMYFLGMVGYILLLKKFSYFSLQSTMLSLVLIMSTLASVFLFDEQIKPINFAGIFLMLASIWMVVR